MPEPERRPSDPDLGSSPFRAEAGTLGVLLCWAVVFADIGTSVYYTPGILFGRVGSHTGLFVDFVFLVFVLLSIKYAEVAIRFPDGGGVVAVASRAIGPVAGLFGGLFIMADYFLTAGISATSGVIYLGVVFPALQPLVLLAAVGALALLGILNVVGVPTSAGVTAGFAIAAAMGQLAVVVAVIVTFGPARVASDFGAMLSGPRLTPVGVITGYAGAFLAFSGLESIAQLAPAMTAPRTRVARRAMLFVVLTMLATSPLLSLWSTTLLPAGVDLNRGVSLLGGAAAGPLLESAVAVSGALLLVFACNTALIGCYHVLIALSRMRFLPEPLQRTNRGRGTPHVSIAVATAVPLVVVFLAGANPSLLGDLYAFGLLGAFTVTSFSLDIIRWNDRRASRDRSHALGTSVPMFVLGVATSVAVLVAWGTNLFAKPLATAYGGGLVLIGLVVAYVTIRWQASRGRYAIFPFLHRPGHPTVLLHRGRRIEPTAVLAMLPRDPSKVDDVVRRALARAERGPVVFAIRGRRAPTRSPRLLEILDPYAEDKEAQAAFDRAEAAIRRARIPARFVYIPAEAEEGTEDWWRQDLTPTHVVTE